MNKQIELQFDQSRTKHKQILIIGQAPPEKKYAVPFSGTRLYNWFERIGINKQTAVDLIEFEALVDKFPGKNNKGHAIPDTQSILEHLPLLAKKIIDNKFDLIIPVGKLAIQYVLGNRDIQLPNAIGKLFICSPFGESYQIKKHKIIPLPHPSGASSWIHMENNVIAFEEALFLIKNNINF